MKGQLARVLDVNKQEHTLLFWGHAWHFLPFTTCHNSLDFVQVVAHASSKQRGRLCVVPFLVSAVQDPYRWITSFSRYTGAPRAISSLMARGFAYNDGLIPKFRPVIICTFCWDLGRTNSPTSARRGDGLGYIRISATPPKRLVFWDGAPSPSLLYW